MSAPLSPPIATEDRDVGRTSTSFSAPAALVPHRRARPRDYLPASYLCVRIARFASFVAFVGEEPIRSSYEWKAGGTSAHHCAAIWSQFLSVVRSLWGQSAYGNGRFYTGKEELGIKN